MHTAYDEVPYENMPFPQALPRVHATVATLHGLTPPDPRTARVLELGCGGGAHLAGVAAAHPEVTALGIDLAPTAIATARESAAAAGLDNVRFEVADVQAGGLEAGFDRAFSRFGTMFFANPVVALRKVREALVPGGELCMVVWRQKADNPWMYAAELAVQRFLERNEDSDEPTCGPGPFSMANADTTTGILVAAGYRDITLARTDIPMLIGRDLEEATDYLMALGPAGEIIRLAGEDADRIRPQLVEAVHGALEPFAGPNGVRAQMSTWAIGARAPEQA
jgi:SAM-dependent methyltransferase